MIDGPGTGWALVICDQLAILCTPLEYCKATVFPIYRVVVSDKYTQGYLTYVGKFSIFKYHKIMLFA